MLFWSVCGNRKEHFKVDPTDPLDDIKQYHRMVRWLNKMSKEMGLVARGFTNDRHTITVHPPAVVEGKGKKAA
jgi:hypothetical protein